MLSFLVTLRNARTCGGFIVVLKGFSVLSRLEKFVLLKDYGIGHGGGVVVSLILVCIFDE